MCNSSQYQQVPELTAANMFYFLSKFTFQECIYTRNQNRLELSRLRSAEGMLLQAE